MKNSIVKLEDFELDEISGGGTAKEVGALAVKVTCSIVFGSVGCFLLCLSFDKFGYFDSLKDFLKNKIVVENNGDIAHYIAGSICFGIPNAFAGVAGWKLGSLLCKKLGLED